MQNIGTGRKGSTGWLNRLLVLAGIYIAIPFLWVSVYNQPAGDDYFTAVRDANTSLGTALHDSYFSWSGRYFALVVARINPLLYHSTAAYKVYPVALLLLFSGALFALVRQFFSNYLSIKHAAAATIVIAAAYLTSMPSVSEGFYWFSAAWVYQLANILYMFLLVVLAKLVGASSNNQRAWLFFPACILSVCIIGLNEISLIITCITLAAFAWFAHRRVPAAKYWLAVLAIIGVIAGAAGGFAPGNFERLNHQQEYSSSWLWTFSGGVSITVIYVLQWLTQLFVVTLVYIPVWGRPLAQRMVNAGACYTVSLRKVILVFMGVFILLQLFTVFTAGGSNAGRIQNVIYLFFLLGYFLILQLYLLQQAKQGERVVYTRQSLLYKMAVLLFFLGIADINNNISTAWIDVVSGKAKQYNKQLNQRAVFAKRCTQDTCLVPALTVVPKTIFFEDIKWAGDSVDLWLNRAYSAYMGKHYITTNAPLPPAQSNIETVKNLGKQVRELIFSK
ncbi:MAG TPA: DUF6056 family protein [Chitinophagaceae bacterium]|nr:DUF6056 family protein [Chitinophagaceae bacterium]